jgi:hypothetical protein
VPLTPEMLAAISAKAAQRNAATAGMSASKSERTKVTEIYQPKSGILEVVPVIDSDGALTSEFMGHPDVKGKKILMCGDDGSCIPCDRIKSSGRWDESWKFRAREFCLIFLMVVRLVGVEPKVTKFLKDHVGRIVLMRGFSNLANVVADVWSGLSDDEKATVFSSGTTTYRVISLQFNGYFAPIQWQWKRLKHGIAIPAINGLPPLSRALGTAVLDPDRTVLAGFLADMEKSRDLYLNIKDTPGEVRAPGVVFEDDEGCNTDDNARKHQVELVNPVQDDTSQVPPNCPSTFGAKPDGYKPQCMACPAEHECAAATASAAKV